MTLHHLDHHAQDRRSRAEIREALDQTLLVEAGAGTGKTHALVDRIVSLVLNGRALERIIAITFTERAAAELSERIRLGLEEKLAREPQYTRLIGEALAAIDRAQISTIHSFCQALLRRFAPEARTDPSFEVQDEVMSERRFEEQWRIHLDRLGSDPGALAAIDRVLALGLTTADIETLAKDLNARLELVLRLERRLPSAPEPAWPELRPMLADLHGLLAKCRDSGDKLYEKIVTLKAVVENLADASEDNRESALAAGVSQLPWNGYSGGRQENWGGADGKEDAINTANAIGGRLAILLAACRSAGLSGLMPYIIQFVRNDSIGRGRDGKLTFDDLIIRARDLLAENAGAVRSLRQAYDVMLIDEFQDTDPLQVDIAMAFATNPDTGEIEPGRLFLVGDPKQSIYRFRRADMAIYSRARTQIERANGRFPRLSVNWRSRSAVLDRVNAVFKPLIGDGDEPDIQPPYAPINAFRSDDLEGPGVAWTGETLPGVTARAARQAEAEAVAAHCAAVVENRWQVVDRETREKREAQLADIAILIPTRTILPALERALPAARVPYRVEGGSLVYRTQEVRDLTNCLTAIDDPSDEVAIVAALRSPAFACSDVDLARYKAGGGRFDYQWPGLTAAAGPVADALRVIHAYHQNRHDSSLAALVETFASDRGLIETGILDAGDRNSFRRVRFLVDQARAFESSEPMSLRAFIRWLENRSERRILDNEAAALDAEDEDAVRITTIHGAKGLEYPIVFLAGLSWYPTYRAATYAVDRTTDEVAICVGAKTRNSRFELGDVEHLNEVETKHLRAEYARALYVACTRARDHLVVSLFRSERAGAECGAQRLIAAGIQNQAPRLELPADTTTRDRRPFEGLRIDSAVPDEELIASRHLLVDSSHRRRFTSATALKGMLSEAAREEDTEPWARGRGGTRLGRAVHAAIQALPWDADDATIRAYADAEAVAEAVPARAADVARFVGRALVSAAAQRARDAQKQPGGRALREVPFGVVIGGTTLEGFIDVLIDGPEGIEIVDWKTDQISASQVEERLEVYKLQAGLYVLGIEEATGRRVSKVTYVFTGPEVERSPGDPSGLARQAKLQLEASA